MLWRLTECFPGSFLRPRMMQSGMPVQSQTFLSHQWCILPSQTSRCCAWYADILHMTWRNDLPTWLHLLGSGGVPLAVPENCFQCIGELEDITVHDGGQGFKEVGRLFSSLKAALDGMLAYMLTCICKWGIEWSEGSVFPLESIQMGEVEHQAVDGQRYHMIMWLKLTVNPAAESMKVNRNLYL